MRIRDPRTAELLDQALACFLPGPRSYSGEDMAEVQAHGGLLNLQRLLRLFVELGARPAAPGEFTRRAFVNGRLDLSQAEAVAEVIGARSEQALRNAQALLAGELGGRLAPLRQELVQITALVEASIDFAEELEALPATEALLDRVHRLAEELSLLAGSHTVGRRLQGARVGLVGAVNAGKSTLFNKLIGSCRALVSEEPGTTRDYLEAEVSWGGHRLQLVDCAGWRAPAEQSAIERAGCALAEGALRSCDLLLEVIDLAGAAPPQVAWPQLAELPVLRVGNKIDLVSAARQSEELDAAGGELALASALTGEGIPELRALLVERLFAGATDESFFVTEVRHWRALQEAIAALKEAEQALQRGLASELVAEPLRQAARALDSISGKVTSDAVLDEIFQRFCLGK